MNGSDTPDGGGLDPPETVELDGASPDAEILGGKGASIDRLVALGLRVPPSGVVTTIASRRFAAQDAITALLDDIAGGSDPSPAEIDDVFVATPLPRSMQRAVAALAASVGGSGRLAVRSSATVEDLAGSSFAGQYRSVLDVDAGDPTAVETAVKLVLASLWHPAPRAYRAAFGIDDADAAMAVVVMPMVPATRAGVVFTVDPAGAPGSARVEVVDGLGESLVSGQRTPDAYVLQREGPHDPDVPPEVVAALDAALTVEQAVGTPQDVEWAWADDTLWLVQARPITVGAAEGDGFDSPIDDHELTTAGIGEMLPGVLAPLSWELNGALVNEAFGNLVAGLGAPSASLDDRPFVRRIAGRAALDFSRLQELAAALPGGSPDELELQYFGSRRPGRPAAETAAGAGRWQSLLHDLRSGALRRRANLDAEICIEAVAALIEELPSVEDLEDGELLAYRARLFDLAMRTAIAEMIVAAGATTAYRKIELLLLPHLGAAAAGHHAEMITTGRGVAVTPHLDASAALFGGPTWRELARVPAAPVAHESATHAWHELQRALAVTESWGGDGFRAVVRTRALRRITEDAVALLRRREAAKAALLRVGGEMRRVHLELGRRLVGRGAVDAPIDIELLTTSEVEDSLLGHPPPPLTIASRRRWVGRHRAEPPLPVRFVGRPVVQSVELPAGGRFEGWAASPGRYEGLGFVIESADEELPEGAVLVASATDASWSPLFLRAGAIVVERGGPLSHAAILARELGVPAVLNVIGATQHLDGALLTVDGDAGVVVAHEAAT